MSVQIVREQIQRFVKSETPEVMSITGQWGVGKTFSWNLFLQEAKNRDEIALGKYSYVSLFGLNSLEALRFTLFEQLIDRRLIGSSPSIETFRTSGDELLKSLGRKSIQLFQGVPLIRNFGPAIESISFLSVRNTIVCIDDFERKGSELAVRDVMGLVSVLKEQKGCKVALILNSDSFDGGEADEFQKYREKVVDFELEFAPTAKESVEIALSPDDPVATKLGEFCVLLGIANIRIIKRIERLAREISAVLVGFEEEVINQALHTLTLFGWCSYSGEEDAVDYDFAKSAGSSYFFETEQENETDEQKQWRALLRNYNFMHTDDFDLEIARVVEAGFVNQHPLRVAAEQKNAEVLASKSERSFTEAWKLFHESFADNQDEVVDGLFESLAKNARFISPMNLTGTVSLLRELDRDDRADEMVQVYIAARRGEKGFFDLESYSFRSEVRDEKLIEAFRAEHESSVEERSLAEVLSDMAQKSGWSPEDLNVLSNASANDYYEVFKNPDGARLSAYVDAALQFGRFANATEQQKQIGERATGALRQIASESRINEIRVSRYGLAPLEDDGG